MRFTSSEGNAMSQAIDTSTDDELNPGHWESLATRELQALLLHHRVIYGIQNDAAMIAPLVQTLRALHGQDPRRGTP